MLRPYSVPLPAPTLGPLGKRIEHVCPKTTEQHGRYTVWIVGYRVSCPAARALYRRWRARERAHPPHVGGGAPTGTRAASYTVGSYACRLYVFDKTASIYRLICRAPHHRRVDISRA